MAGEAPGLRARKKARTRAAIADAALELFLERGFDAVTTTEIAAAAEVSPATVFNHFPTKEALVLDEDAEREHALLAAVRERPAGTSVVDALHRHFAAELDGDLRWERERRPSRAEFRELISSTPGLREYSRRMWARYKTSLAQVIAADIGRSAPDPYVTAFAHLVIEAHAMTNAPGPDPRAGLDATFALLRPGWDALISSGDHPCPNRSDS